jgi:DNA-binding MarR family transcriptional regulator
MVTPRSVLEILAKLEDRGLVRRDVHADHGRIRQTELLRDGRALIRGAGEVARELQDELMAAVPARERQVVLEAMLSAMGGFALGSVSGPGKLSAEPLSTEPRGAPISPQPK